MDRQMSARELMDKLQLSRQGGEHCRTQECITISQTLACTLWMSTGAMLAGALRCSQGVCLCALCATTYGLHGLSLL